MHRLARDGCQTRQNFCIFRHGGREFFLTSVDPVSAIKSYMKSMAYTAPAAHFMQPGELSGLVLQLGLQ